MGNDAQAIGFVKNGVMMESSDKVLSVLFVCMFGGIALGAISSAVKESIIAADMAKSGLQQCVVKVNDKEEILWKKECKDEN
jgi:hypothetical protein